MVLCALVGGAFAYHHASSSAQKYEASSQLLFGTNLSVLNALGVPTNTNNGSTTGQATNVGLTSLPIISTRTQQALGTRTPPDGVNVATSSVGSTNLVNVTATSSTPAAAELVANTYANQFVLYTQQQQQQQLNQAISQIQHELSVRRLSGLGQNANLQATLANLEVIDAANPVGVSVAQPAGGASAVSRKTKTRAVEGIVLGAIVGVLIIVLLDWFDPRLRDVTDDEFYGLQVIALKDLRKRGGPEATTAITRRLLSEAARRGGTPPRAHRHHFDRRAAGSSIGSAPGGCVGADRSGKWLDRWDRSPHKRRRQTHRPRATRPTVTFPLRRSLARSSQTAWRRLMFRRRRCSMGPPRVTSRQSCGIGTG